MWDHIVAVLRELSSPGDRRLAQRAIRVDGRHRATVGAGDPVVDVRRSAAELACDVAQQVGDAVVDRVDPVRGGAIA